MNAAPTCAVIGAGAAGAAAAYALARRGARVTLFEQFSLSHDRGSSHGATRLFRTAYFEHPDYVPLLKRSAALWRALERDSGERLLDMTGVLMAGGAQSGLIAGTRRAAADHGLALETLTRADAARRFPSLVLSATMEAMIEPEAGFIYADRAVKTFASGARKAGAVFRQNAAVHDWRSVGAQIEITIRDERLTFDRLIVAPGAFAAGILGRIGALIKPLRKTLFWTAPGDDRFSSARGFLPFAVEEDDGRFFYGFPAVDGNGVKIGEHTGGAQLASPDEAAPEAAAMARDDIEAFLHRRTQGFEPRVSKEQSCLYEMSPDGHFIIDKHPDDARVVFALGLSGHGFKFAPVIGEALADLAINGETLREFDFLKLARFDQA
jgi:sarcosine oxidase